MKRVLKSLPILVCLFLHQTNLLASSHREAPLIAYDPQADNTDVYAFRSPTDSSKVVLIADYIPFQHPAGGPNWYHFGPNIRYEIHVKNKTTTTGDDITYRFTFTQMNQDPTTFFNIRLGKENLKTTYMLEKIVGTNAPVVIVANGKVPPNNIGPRSIESGVGLGATAGYDSVMMSSIMPSTGTGGEKVFAGPADDPFFVDLGGAFDLGGFRMPGRDGLNRMNVHSICIEVPIATLQKDGKTTAQATSILDGDFVIGVWASASRRQMTTLNPGADEHTVAGDWVQVSRLGMPLVNEAINPIGEKDRWNATTPYGNNDLPFAKNFTNPELALYMDDSRFGTIVPGLAALRIQTKSLANANDPKGFDFRNDSAGLYKLKGNPALVGTALDPATYGDILLPNNHSPRAVDILPIFYTGVPNLAPYQLATGKPVGSPLSPGKPFINNFLPTLGDMLRLNMAVPVTPRTMANGMPNPQFSSLGLVQAAVLGLTNSAYAGTGIQNIPNMDGFPNGRRLEDDVTTIELQAVGGVVLAAIGLWYDDYNVSTPNANPVTPQLVSVLSFNAGVTKNDTTLKATFPYVQGPWRGFTGPSFVGPTPCGAPTDRLYVNAALPTSGSGSTWECGMKELREAVKIANSNPAIKSIWVAGGTYNATTTRGIDDHLDISRADLKILGGFSGNETLASQARPDVNMTIISGDIGMPNVATDNSTVMMLIHNVPTNASRLVIDGFIFEKANANESPRDYGGAFNAYYNTTQTPVQIKRCIFRNNVSTNVGGAITMDHSPIEFDSCRFTNNTSPVGGAVFSFQSSPTFSSCVFAQNTSTRGGAYFGNYGLVSFYKTVFSANTADNGGAVYQNSLDVNYINSLFSKNTATQQGGAIFENIASNLLIQNTTLYGNAAGTVGGGIASGNPGTNTVTSFNSIFYKNTRGGADNILLADVGNANVAPNTYANTLLQANSEVPADNGAKIRNNIRGINPQFTNELNPIGADGLWFTADDGLQIAKLSPVKDKGDNSLAPAGTDINNNPRIACTTVDLGAYEQQVCASPFRTAPVITDIAGAVANPFNNDLQIRYSGEEKANVRVMSLSGKVMAVSATAAKGITHVNATTWTSGIYQVEIITTSGKTVNFKVVKL